MEHALHFFHKTSIPSDLLINVKVTIIQLHGDSKIQSNPPSKLILFLSLTKVFINISKLKIRNYDEGGGHVEGTLVVLTAEIFDSTGSTDEEIVPDTLDRTFVSSDERQDKREQRLRTINKFKILRLTGFGYLAETGLPASSQNLSTLALPCPREDL